MDTFYTIKQGQSHTYTKDGKRLLITKLSAKPLVVVQVKQNDKDGYNAVQIGLGSKKRLNKPTIGHVKAAEIKPRYLREIRLEEQSTKQVKDAISVTEVFKIGDKVQVRSEMKGKGFAGGIKRWGFHGGPKTHGQSDRHRAPGAIAQGTTPGRIWKGKHMAGRMGGVMISIGGGQIVKIDENLQELWITGTVPGTNGTIVEMEKIGEKPFSGLNIPEEKIENQTVIESETNE